jgi:hypothetical protein
LKEQTALGTFEWAVSHIIDKADMPLFEKKYHNDAKGAAAYPPALLLKAILFCYSRGIISPRKIEDLKKKRDKLEKYIERVIKQHRELDKEEKAHPHGAAAKRSRQFKETMGQGKTAGRGSSKG